MLGFWAVAASCTMMHQDLDDCPVGLYLTFAYDYNLERADMFNDHVGSVTVYVYDSTGHYVTKQEEVNTETDAPTGIALSASTAMSAGTDDETGVSSMAPILAASTTTPSLANATSRSCGVFLPHRLTILADGYASTQHSSKAISLNWSPSIRFSAVFFFVSQFFTSVSMVL